MEAKIEPRGTRNHKSQEKRTREKHEKRNAAKSGSLVTILPQNGTPFSWPKHPPNHKNQSTWLQVESARQLALWSGNLIPFMIGYFTELQIGYTQDCSGTLLKVF